MGKYTFFYITMQDAHPTHTHAHTRVRPAETHARSQTDIAK